MFLFIQNALVLFVIMTGSVCQAELVNDASQCKLANDLPPPSASIVQSVYTPQQNILGPWGQPVGRMHMNGHQRIYHKPHKQKVLIIPSTSKSSLLL